MDFLKMYILSFFGPFSTTITIRKNRNYLTVNQAILHLYHNFKCSKKADPNLEMAGLGLLFDDRFINHVCKIRLYSHLN